MDIQPLNGILNGIGSGGEWDEQRQLQRLMSQWEAIVGATVAQHSCPLEVRNGVLQVATSTAVWAQNLSFERRRILTKLNQRAHFQILGLKEIRFSTAQWHNRPGSSGAITLDKRLNSYQQQVQWQQHPSRLPPPQSDRPQAEPAPNAEQAFDRWSQRRQQQVNQVPPCPQCQTPTPEGELQRWGICAFCMTQQWEADKNANQPDGAQEAESWAQGAPSSVTVEEARQARSLASSANGDAQERAPEFSQRQAPGVMVQRSQGQRAADSPRTLSQRPPQRESSSSAAPRQLQPLAGLPPVAWPIAATPAGMAIPPTTSQPKVLPDNAPSEQRSPAPAIPPEAFGPDRSDAKPAFPQRLSQPPALSGPLAPLSLDEQQMMQQPLPIEESLPNLRNNSPPAQQQQAAWAKAFHSLRSQEEQRQRQQAELEQRTAERIRQARGDREAPPRPQPATDASLQPDAISPDGSPNGNGAVSPATANLTSGRTKPMLKRSRQIPPPGITPGINPNPALANGATRAKTEDNQQGSPGEPL